MMSLLAVLHTLAAKRGDVEVSMGCSVAVRVACFVLSSLTMS
jgi:hypothetical protein